MFMQASAIQVLMGKISKEILAPFVELLVALAVVYFFWGIAKFMMSSDDAQAQTDVKKHITWGVAGIFIMVSVWGLISIVQSTLGKI